MRSSLRFGVASAVITAAASSALATTVTLSNNTSTGGLNLNSANVLFAAAATDTSTLSSTAVQGVSFTPMTTTSSGGNTFATASGNNITITTTLSTAYPKEGSYAFEYANATVDATTLTYTTSKTLGFNSSQPNDSLRSLLTGGIEYNNANPLTITISGLQTGSQYVIDLLTSDIGYSDRTQTVSFNGGLSASDGGSNGYYLFAYNGATGVSGNSFGYDTTDTVTALGGQITIGLNGLDSSDNYSNSSNNDTDPLFNALAISIVPEPASIGLTGIAVIGLAMRRRRRL